MREGKGYFTGSAAPTETIRYSYGYSLPRRGFTRNDGTDNVGFSRLTDGDEKTFWKSNPYLAQPFTGESDELHPQWVVMDLAQVQEVNSVRIAWGDALREEISGAVLDGRRSDQGVTRGVWQTFPKGAISEGKRVGANDPAECGSDGRAVRAYLDDGIVEHMRCRWSERSTQLRGLCDS
jgi:hypothetical protein